MKIYLILIALIITFETSALAQLQGKAKLDSMLQELPKAKNDTNKVRLLSLISFSYSSINPKLGVDYGKKAISLSTKLNWDKGLAISNNSIGVNYHTLSDYENAILSFKKTLSINQKLKDNHGIAVGYLNIGQLYSFKSDYPKALEYYKNALKINEKIGDSLGIALSLTNIGNIYYYQYNYNKAIEYHERALVINKEIDNSLGLSNNYGGIGTIYKQLSNFNKAKEFLEKALAINTNLDNKHGIAINLGALANVEADMGNYSKALKLHNEALVINKEMNSLSAIANNLGNIGSVYYSLSQDSVLKRFYEDKNQINLQKEINLNKSIIFTNESIEIFEKIGERHNLYFALMNLSDAYKDKGDYKKTFEYYKKSKEIQDSIFSQENTKTIANLEVKSQAELKDKEISILKLDQEKQELQTFVLIGGICTLVLIVGIIFYQRRKSEALLLNMLPSKITKRLKSKEKNIADDIDSATTVFIDLVGFTSYAKDKSASEVLGILNNIFSRFDKLVKEYGLEKIKTIGDGYMAASGVPEPRIDHAQKAVEFTMAVRNELNKFNKETANTFNARIGLETGPVIAGVIGDSKFIYDLWGDSVNTASRMESTGVAGQIQITENVKIELEKMGTNYKFTKREPIEVKGKGLMQTYFID